MIQHWMGLGDLFRFPGDLFVLFGVASFIYFFGGKPFLKGLVDELRARRPGMMTLVALAITTAYLYSSTVVLGLAAEILFWETATLIVLMLLGHWVEMKSVVGASKALEQLAELMPSAAHRLLPDGSAVDVELGDVQAGDILLVRPGEKVPADGLVTDGISTVNESMLTGESTPVVKTSGAAVIGGSVNGEGSLTIMVQKTGNESFLSQVIGLVREAQQSKSKTQDLADRAALWLTALAIAGGAATFSVWTWISNAEIAFALERTVTVMVIACPHALGLAVPLVVAVSTALSAGHGLLIRNRVAFEQARNIGAVVFDKTGTLTEGRFGVTDIVPFADSLGERELLRLAASVEVHSEHPVAGGIVRRAETMAPVSEFRAIPGKGVEGTVDG
jgi:Cu2+-exporting ATPase